MTSLVIPASLHGYDSKVSEPLCRHSFGSHHVMSGCHYSGCRCGVITYHGCFSNQLILSINSFSQAVPTSPSPVVCPSFVPPRCEYSVLSPTIRFANFAHHHPVTLAHARLQHRSNLSIWTQSLVVQAPITFHISGPGRGRAIFE